MLDFQLFDILKRNLEVCFHFGTTAVCILFFFPAPLLQHSGTAVTDNSYKGILSALQQTVNIFMNGGTHANRHIPFKRKPYKDWKKNSASATEHVHF